MLVGNKGMSYSKRILLLRVLNPRLGNLNICQCNQLTSFMLRHPNPFLMAK